MKKVLLTTTAMVAFAGAASAEVSLSGYAEIGIKGGTGMETQLHDDIDVSFTLSGETDNGLTFGAKIDLDEADVGAFTGGPSQLNSVFISGGFGKITLGDTDGALDWAMQDVGIGSSLTDDHTTHAGYNGNAVADGVYDGQVLRYDNTFGDFGVALSAELDDTGVGSTNWGLGVKYNVALGGVDLGLGLGYQDNSVSDATGLSIDAKFGSGFRAILNYTDYSNSFMGSTGLDGLDKHVGLGLGYTSGALTVSANYGVYSGVLVNTDRIGYGVAVNYDLGGGAVVMAGYGRSEVEAGAIVAADVDAGSNTWSLGLGLSF